MTEPLDLPRHPALRVAALPGKGRGLVAIEPVRHGELLEAAPVVPLALEHRLAADHPLEPYAFAWDEAPFREALAFGVISVINHSPTPNARLVQDHTNRVLRAIAAADIAAGEEITFDYGIPLWFEAAG